MTIEKKHETAAPLKWRAQEEGSLPLLTALRKFRPMTALSTLLFTASGREEEIVVKFLGKESQPCGGE